MSRANALRVLRSYKQNIQSPWRFQRLIATRQFSSTILLAKKKQKAANIESNEVTNQSKSSKSSSTIDNQDDAFDFTSMERKILKAIEHMTHKLAELKSGGSFNTAALENLQVQPSKDSKDVLKLSDLAQVVTKGRQINVILSDERHIKPVKSAIQSSNLSLTPQGPTESDPTTLVIHVPPPTGESRQAAIDSATRLSTSALDQIREARAGKNKKLRAMQIAKTVNPDQIQKAQKEMEVIIQRFSNEVKQITETHKKIISH